MADTQKQETKKPSRSPKGEGTTLSVDLTEHPDLLKSIRDAADADDRPASVWLRRKIVALHKEGKLA